MSDYITFEIQEDIIKRLPVKSLIQFRSVSKAWKSLIDSPEFIAAYSLCHTHPRHLLISKEFRVGIEGKFVSFVDDDTFPQQRSVPTVPLPIELHQNSVVVGSSGGLLCLYNSYPGTANPSAQSGKKTVVIWNPSIRKSVAIDVCNTNDLYQFVLGFGVCPVTSDPKIVKITKKSRGTETYNSIPWKVEVYTLSSREWRTPSCNLPPPSIGVKWNQVVIDRFIYWLALNIINDGYHTSYTIMSFDMTNDEFREVYLPESLTHPDDPVEMRISKISESLVVLEYIIDIDKRICVVWMMEHGVPKSFTHLFTIKIPHASIMNPGFRFSGEPIIKMRDNNAEGALVVYEPYSEHIIDLGISGRGCSFSVISYMETLLLLNQ